MPIALLLLLAAQDEAPPPPPELPAEVAPPPPPEEKGSPAAAAPAPAKPAPAVAAPSVAPVSKDKIEEEEEPIGARMASAAVGGTVGAVLGLAAGFGGIYIVQLAAPAAFEGNMVWIPLLIPPVLLVGGAALGGGLGPVFAGQSPSGLAALGGALGSVTIGAVGAAPGLYFTAQSFEQAQNAQSCEQGCGYVITALIGIVAAYAGFTICGVCGGLGGSAGAVLLEGKKELPPVQKTPPAKVAPPIPEAAPPPPPATPSEPSSAEGAPAPPAPLNE